MRYPKVSAAIFMRELVSIEPFNPASLAGAAPLVHPVSAPHKWGAYPRAILALAPMEFLEKLAALVAQGRDGPPCSILLPFPINGEL